MKTHIKKLLKWSIYGLLCLLFCFLSSVNIYELMDSTQTGKFIVFSYAVCLLVVLSVTTLVLSKEYSLKINLVDVALLILLVYISINRYLLQPQYGFSIAYYELLGLAVIYIVLRLMDPRLCMYLFAAVILGGTIQAVYGNLQLYGYFPSNHEIFNMTGSYFNPGPYAGYLSSVFPAALGIYLFKENLTGSSKAGAGKLKNYHKIITGYIPLAGLISILLVIPASQSRAAWLALLAAAIFLIGYRYRVFSSVKSYLSTRLKKNLAAVLLAFVLSVGIAGAYFFKKDSADGRMLIWKVTMNMIGDHPLTGLGFDRFKSGYMNYQAEYFRTHPGDGASKVADNVNYAFNEPLQFMSENGFAGTLILFFILALLLRTGYSGSNPVLLIAKAGLLSVIVFGLFSYPGQILPIKLNAIFYLGVISTFNQKPVISIKKWNVAVMRATKTCIIVLGFIGVFFTAGYIRDVYRGFKNWYMGFSMYQNGKYMNAVNYYREAYPVMSKDGLFLGTYGKALSMIGDHQKAIEILTRARQYRNSTIIETGIGDSYKETKQYSLAEKAYTHAGHMTPGKFYPHYLLAKIYHETGQKEKAIDAANKLMTKEIKIESDAINQIRAEMEAIINQY